LIYLWIYFGAVQNCKATGDKCKIQQPCSMKNCMAQCQGLCDAMERIQLIVILLMEFANALT